MSTKLITVPTFTFNQGDILAGDVFERPIQVDFYRNGIQLRQDGEFKDQETIIIEPKYLKEFCRTILAMQKEADSYHELKEKK